MGSAGLKTLTELGKLMGQGTAANEERLLSFIAVFQRDNNGATPSYSAMANQLGIVEEGAKILLARLENKGRLHFVSRNPPRIMLTGGGPLPHEPTAADLANAKPGAAGRFLEAEGERMRLARFIGGYEREHGRGPSLREMCDFVGFGTPSYVGRMAEMLAEKGLVQYGHGVPTKLTELGRQLYGFKAEPKMEQKMEQTNNKRTVVVVQRGRKPAASRAKQLCETLAAHLKNGGDNYIRYDDLAERMGYAPTSGGAISDIAKEAVKVGWLAPKPFKSRGLFFTEKGKQRFMPEALAPEAETIHIETPIVAQVAAAVRRPAVVREHVNGGLDFNLTSGGLQLTGKSNSRAELEEFAARLLSLAPMLGE